MEELLLKLKELDIHVAVENDNLKLNIPEGVDETVLLKEVKENKHELIDYILKRKKQKKNFKKIPRSNRNTSTRLTPAQARLYVLQELVKDSIAYNIPFAFEINGSVDVNRLQTALTRLIERHESLRTYFVVDKNYKPVQKVLEEFEFVLKHDICEEKDLESIIQNFSNPFDLQKAPLIRANLVELSSTHFILLIDIHHIISDGISFQVFLSDLGAFYSQQELPELSLQYRDYAQWYYSIEHQSNLQEQKSFWLQELSGFSNTAILPTDFAKPKEISFEGEQIHFKINAKRKRILDGLKKSTETSLFAVLISFYGLFQSKLTSVDDLVIGTPVGGRGHGDLDQIIGMFVNTLAIRLHPKSNTNFRSYLKGVGKKTLTCFDHQEYPYEELIEDLGLTRSNKINPLFNTIITLNNIKQTESRLSDFNIKPYEIAKSTSKFDLMIHFNEIDNELDCTFEYSTHLFKKETIELFFTYFNNLIDQVGDNEHILLGDVSLLDKTTRQQLLELNDFTGVKYPDQLTLVDMFESQVAKTPNKLALLMSDDTMTYKEVNQRANQVARMLRSNGVNREAIVGLLMGKTFETVIGMLGILKAGGAYLPIDVTYPQNRIQYTLESSGAEIVLSVREHESSIEEKNLLFLYIDDAASIKDTSNLDTVNTPNDLCYVLYTSGTTGNPKGVMIEHRNVVRLLFNESFQYTFGEDDVWTMFHSHCFDVSVWEMYGALLNGGKLIIIPPEIARDPLAYMQILHKNDVTVLNQTPTAFYNLATEVKREGITLPKLRYVVFAGEALLPSKLKDWFAVHPNTKLINMYGITEVTVHMTYKEIGKFEIEHSVSNIGRPLPTGSIYLLDDQMKLVSQGVIGEIYVGGEGVARGYLNNEALTNSRFTDNPYKKSDRLYRSGDLAVLLSNGELEYKGRTDHQVQLKGFRIELGEIEHQLLSSEYVENVVVLDKKDKGEDQPYLCAYIVGTEKLSVEYLRNYLAERVPFYMIPAYFMQVDKIPYTTNNKVDRQKLPAPILTELQDYKAPVTHEHKVMVEIWMKILSASKVGIRDNYFVLGGDSLKAIGLVAEINQKLNSALSIADLYIYQTIEELSYFLSKNENSNQINSYKIEAEKVIERFEKEYRAKEKFKDSYEAVYPMNGVEIGMVFHTMKEQSEDKSIHTIIYHEQNVYPLPLENFSFEIFRKALDLMIEKHSVLRKIYDLDNLAHIVLKDIDPQIDYIDISHLSRDEQEKFIEKKKHEERLKGTELYFSLIWRMTIIKTSPLYQYLLFDFHHSLFGGWSLNSFTTELNNIYYELLKDDQYKPKLLRANYRDQILGEIEASLDTKNIEYWKEELDGYKRLQFVETKLKHEYKMDKYDLGEDFRRKLDSVVQKHNTSFKHLCFAAYIYVMKMLSPANDVTVGIVANNRPLIPDGDKLLGCFLNTVPFRAKIPQNITWGEYVDYIENKLRKFKEHEKVPFYKILEITKEPAEEGNPIFDTSFNYMDFHILNDMVREESSVVIEEGVVGFDNYVNNNTLFDMHVTASNNAFKLWLAYSTTIIDDALSSRIFECFKRVLTSFIYNDDTLINQNDILSESQKHLLASFNDTYRSYDSDSTIHKLFEDQVLETPDAVALTFKGATLSYSDVNKKSNQLAGLLRSKGVTNNTIVGVMQQRSMDMVISILGILKAGGAYLPIDPDYPISRIEQMVYNSGMSLLLSDDDFVGSVIDRVTCLDIRSLDCSGFDSVNLPYISSSSDLLYVIYTSGSTGVPKGVMLNHGNMTNLMDYHINSTSIDTSSVLQFTTLTFDPSFKEIFSALLTGGTVHMIEDSVSKDFSKVLKHIESHAVRTIFMPSSVLNQIFNSKLYQEELPTTLRNIVTAGEQVVVGNLFKQYLEDHEVCLHNHYGPAETHVVTTNTIHPGSGVPTMPDIGKPIQNTQIYILNPEMHLQPIHVAGELYIGGKQVGVGYIQNPELTAERYIDNPYGEGRLYKTGDLARWTSDGSIEFLGRIDDQLKLHGVRIEPGEIESHINAIPEIVDSVVVVNEVHGDKSLIAYYVSTVDLSVSELRNHLLDKLPLSMIPGYYVRLSEMPMTSTGKLDRKSLPSPEGEKVAYQAASTPTEKQLVTLWSELLHLESDQLSVSSSFFDLGGNSLRAVVLINMISKLFSVHLVLKSLFKYQDISSLASYIDSLEKESFIAIPKVLSREYYPLSSAQQRMYFLYEFDKGSTTYNMPSFFRINGKLEISRLEQAFKALVERHQSLRTVFQMIDNAPIQRILSGESFEVARYKADASETSSYINKFVRPFDLSSELPVRIGLIEISKEDALLMVDMHHIINDGVSHEILLKEFWSLYHNEVLPDLRIQYIDYAVWQQSDAHQDLVVKHKQYWLEVYSEEVFSLDLPIDYTRSLSRSDQGEVQSIKFSASKSEQLRQLSRSKGVTMYTLFLAIYNVLLSKLSNQEDIVIGTSTAGRHHADLEGLVGMFVNTLALRNHPKMNSTFEDFLSDVQENTLSAFDHQLYQYEELVDELELSRDVGRNPLFDVFFSYQQQINQLNLGESDLKIESHGAVRSVAKFDLSLEVLDSEESISLSFNYAIDLFKSSTIERFSEYLNRITDAILLDSTQLLGDIEILSPQEKNMLQITFNDTAVDYDLDKTVLDLFISQSKETPDAEAIIFGQERLTYRDLDVRSDLWAQHLVKEGVTSGAIVALVMTRSSEMITAILAVMKVGAAYLPINPDQPVYRTQYMLNESKSTYTITNISVIPEDLEKHYTVISVDTLDKNITPNGIKKNIQKVLPDDLAYIIYTSGSTGQPKGVMINHRSVTNLIHHEREFLEVESSDKILQFSPYYFDVSVEQIWLSLTTGASLLLIDLETLVNKTLFLNYLKEHSVSLLNCTPSFLESMPLPYLPCLKKIVVSGEECKPALANKYSETYSFYNEYGPTEATVISISHQVTKIGDEDVKLPIGRPIANSQAYILNDRLDLLPLGVVGELYLGGEGLSLGYLSRPDLTQKHFVSNPFGEGLLYKTGDLARWLPDGTIEYLGRNDHQVKLRGYRIELNEIEKELENISLVSQALVMIHESKGDKKLIAYYTGEESKSEKIKISLLSKLPAYMIPSNFVWIDAFPTTDNGKINRKALPNPESALSDIYVAPKNEEQEKLCSLWADILGLDENQISVTSDFFDLGGHSLAAITLVNKVSEAFSVNLLLRELFIYRTISTLSEYISGKNKVSFISIPKTPARKYYPLSSAQQRLYFLYEFDKESTAYNLPSFFRIKGTIDLPQMELSFNKLLEFHQSLQTVFKMVDGYPMQRIAQEIGFEIDHFSVLDSEVDTKIKQFIQPFNLFEELPIRVTLMSISDEDHILLIDTHHIVNDGVSLEVLMRDFMSFYSKQTPDTLRIQYTDYAVWQQSEEYTNLVASHKSYWMEKFSEEVISLELPTDHPRPQTLSNQGHCHTIKLSNQQSEKLRFLANSEGVTVYNLFLAIYNVFLNKLTNEEDIVVGTPTAGRHHLDLQGLVGMFVNTLALRNYPKGTMSFKDFLLDLNENTLQALDHQLYQYEELIDELEVSRDINRNALFDVFFTYNKEIEAQGNQDLGLDIRPYNVPFRTSKFDLSLDVIDSDQGISLSFICRKDLFDLPRVEQFTSYLSRIIEEVLVDHTQRIGTINILSEVERDKLLNVFNNTAIAYDLEKTVLDMFIEQAQLTPNAEALVFNEKSFTYKELDDRSDLWASFLIGAGVSQQSIVSLMMTRSTEMITAILAIMKAGAVYLPINPEQPLCRTLQILEESKSTTVISNLSTIPDGFKKDCVWLHTDVIDNSEVVIDKKKLPKSSATDLAYIIYTSGSTGIPKGVMTNHESVTNFIVHQSELFEIDNKEKILQSSPYYFDASVEQIWLALSKGATLVLIDENILLEPTELIDYLKKYQITHLHSTPSLLERIQLDDVQTLNRVVSGGDVCSPLLAQKIGKTHSFYNKYGPTETTISSTIKKISKEDSLQSKITIGYPISNTQAYILDKELNLLPQGTIGELYLGGKGVSRGYLNRSDITKNSFISNPCGESRLYKTGDLARWNSDGTIDFLGRIDNQLKLNGVRIEPGEIERHVNSIEGIDDAVVMIREVNGNKALIAYYVSTKLFSASEIRTYLQDKLPLSMIPGYYVHLEELPLTSTGKLDRRSLPVPEEELLDYQEASNVTEEQLVALWSDVLQLDKDQISVNSSFFDLGGNSLHAVVLINRIRKEFSVQIALKSVFQYQDIVSLGKYIEGLNKESFMTIPKAPDREYYPLSSAQKRMYFLYEFDKESTAYNMPGFFRLKGEVDFSKLELAFKTLVNRHHSLCTLFEMVDGAPCQRVVSDMIFEVVRYKGGTQDIDNYIHEFVRPFDLSSELPIRIGLMEVTGEDALLMVDMHHIISDGISHEILIREFWSLYHNELLPDLPIQYIDYVVWQHSNTHQTLVSDHKAYWLEIYNKKVTTLELPTDYLRPLHPSDHGDICSIQLPKQQRDKLHGFANTHGVTMYTLFLTIYKVLLSKLSNQTDIVVGTSTAGRHHADLEGVVGMFVNTLALRNDVDSKISFRDLLATVNEDTLSAFDHQLYQYEELVDALELSRDIGRNPLFDVFFSYREQSKDSDFKATDLKIKNHSAIYNVAKFDLSLELQDSNEGIDLSFTYRTDLFKPSTIKRFLGYINRIIDEVLIDDTQFLGTIEILAPEERDELLIAFNDTSVDYNSGNTVLDFFITQSLKVPNAEAIIFGKERLTYKELNSLSDLWAQHLVNSGVVQGSVVALVMTRSSEMITAIIAIMKAGAAYLPINPDQPVSRTQYMLDQSDCKLIVTNIDTITENLKSYTCLDMNTFDFSNIKGQKIKTQKVTSDDLAYIMYTSGSTGEPKGCKVTHGNLVNYICWANDYYFTNSEEGNWGLITPISFDLTVTSIYTSLTRGKKLFIGSDQTDIDTLLKESFTNPEIDTLKITPTHLTILKDLDLKRTHIKTIICGGEQLKKSQLEIIKNIDNSIRVYNEYGPTETTVGCIATEVLPEDEKIYIGKPIANTKIQIVNSDFEIVPIGVIGEIYISGLGVSEGYLKKPEITSEKFVYLSEVLHYKTGDLGRWTSKGTIEYIGRTDDQVKIRGYRIEPTEIESSIETLPGIEQAVVTIHGENQKLYAYLKGDQKTEMTELKCHLSEKLPDYMIPVSYTWLDIFPLNPNGKIDKDALPNPDFTPTDFYVAPKNKKQERLQRIWADILGIDQNQISIRSDFFSLGGHSLNAIKLKYEIKKSFKIELPLFEIFLTPTIETLSDKIQERRGDKEEKTSLISLNNVDAEEKLFVIHDGSGEIDGYLELTRKINNYRCYGIKFNTNDTQDVPDITELASRYIKEIKSVQSTGPYTLLGWSLGGVIATEMAALLEKSDEKIENLIIIDSSFQFKKTPKKDHTWLQFSKSEFFKTATEEEVKGIIPLEISQLIPGFSNKNRQQILEAVNTVLVLREVSETYCKSTDIKAKTLYINPTQSSVLNDKEQMKRLFSDLVLKEVTGDHFSVMQLPIVNDLSTIINNQLESKLVKH
ncbi:non-ribosomal peptide synthetase [Aquimarina sediminis]|uniref:non-ribosomal peptide synthetase n=1 Tax=Aquimarina sediminis TaxID=2070536 RepID=UPI000CA06939|nr:non-ribosomal peptide synthetase [Aquimarina sediminis]